jgi:hypothetical protein
VAIWFPWATGEKSRLGWHHNIWGHSTFTSRLARYSP